MFFSWSTLGFSVKWCNISFNSNWVHPPGNPWGSAQKTCPGAGNSTRAGILWKMKVKLKKKAWIKLLQVKTKKASRIFDLFRGLHVFSTEFFVVYGSIFWFCCHTYLTTNLRSCPWVVCLTFSLGYGYPHPHLYKRL